MKGFASLDGSLILRREPPARPPEPLSQELIDALEDRAPHADAPHQLDRTGHQQSPSIGLTANLISAGRAAYRAERQRQAQKTVGLTAHGEVLSPLSFRGVDGRAGTPVVRDVTQPAPLSPYARPATPWPAPSPASPLRDLVPPRQAVAPSPVTPAAEPVPMAEAETLSRRRAVTLRLRPEQHARLLAVRRQLGCSFQVLVVRALSDHLDAIARSPEAAARAPAAESGNADMVSAIDLNEALAADAARHGHKTPDVHFFTLPSGWCVAAWRQQRGHNAATPSEVLGQVLKDHGLAELIQADDAEGAESVLENVSLGDGGHRLALTIRLEPELHNRLQAARDRLERTGQDILLDSINAYLDA